MRVSALILRPELAGPEAQIRHQQATAECMKTVNQSNPKTSKTWNHASDEDNVIKHTLLAHGIGWNQGGTGSDPSTMFIQKCNAAQATINFYIFCHHMQCMYKVGIDFEQMLLH